MRKVLAVASALALLAALYAAAGYWVAPRLLHDALIERAKGFGLALELGGVRTDPFTLRVTFQGLRVLAGGRELAAARSLVLDLAWSSLWSDAWRVQQATLRAPRVDLETGPDGALGLPRGGGGDGTVPLLVVQSLEVTQGALQVLGFEFRDIELRADGLSTREGDQAAYALSAEWAKGGVLSSRGSVALEPRIAHGTFEAAAVPLAALASLGLPQAESARGEAHGSAKFSYQGDRLELREVNLEGERLAYAGIEFATVRTRTPRLVLPPEGPFQVELTARAAPGGKLSASGRVALQPLSADLQVEAADVALVQAGRFLPDGLQVTIASGSASASGRLRIKPQASSFDGAIAVSDARFEERASGQLLLAWSELATEQAVLSFPPLRAQLGEVLARAPSGRLVIEEDGGLNFARLMPNGAARGGRGVELTLRRLRIEQGMLDFSDRSLENDFSVTVRQLEGSITGFNTAPGDPARVQLEGRVAQYGAARIRGTVDLQQPKSLTSISATLRNVPLAELTPYVVKFAGYRVESGRLSADLRYRVREARLVGQNQLTFEELQLGAKVERPGVADLPLELAVALLADARGRIRLDIPVSGNLNDPQFDFGGLVARALGNVVGKIVSAPFRVLAAAFGREEGDFGTVRFEPGAAELSPPAEETVAQVAKALAERPRLAVTVQGGYDPERDLRALRRAQVRREVAQRAGVDVHAPPDFGDPKVLQAAERLYLERVGSRAQMLELRESEPRYARALVEALTAATPADEEAAQILARARAEIVRAGLLAYGLEPSRISVDAPATRKAGEEGVPTELALDITRGGAAAGATTR